MRGISDVQDDKIRILTTIIQRIVINATVWYPHKPPDVGCYCESAGFSQPPPVGSLVVCNTSGVHDWTVGFVDSVSPKQGAFGSDSVMIREIGSNRLCDVSNDSFYIIKGMHETDLLEGLRYEFYKKIRRTLYEYGDDNRRYSHIKFIDEQYAEVYIREKWNGAFSNNGAKSIPFPLKLKWNRKKVSMKKLMQEMEEQGYLTREFQKEEQQEDVGKKVIGMEIGKDFVATIEKTV